MLETADSVDVYVVRLICWMAVLVSRLDEMLRMNDDNICLKAIWFLVSFGHIFVNSDSVNVLCEVN